MKQICHFRFFVLFSYCACTPPWNTGRGRIELWKDIWTWKPVQQKSCLVSGYVKTNLWCSEPRSFSKYDHGGRDSNSSKKQGWHSWLSLEPAIDYVQQSLPLIQWRQWKYLQKMPCVFIWNSEMQTTCVLLCWLCCGASVLGWNKARRHGSAHVVERAQDVILCVVPTGWGTRAPNRS